MRYLKIQLLAGVLASVLVVAAQGARPTHPPVTWEPTQANFTPAHRKPGDIHYIVIHTTEGSADGAVSWFENDAAHASAHFVIDREGHITQLVRVHNIAWHAGNWNTNVQSIGIEHEGISDDPSGYTPAEYRASARLVAYLALTFGVPINRRHIIGHSEVPDPNDPTQFGGIDHHTDPGQYWNWAHYMKLVRKYAHLGPHAPPVRISGVAVGNGRVLSGFVAWHAAATKGVQRVEFRVDGKLVGRDGRRPFVLPRLNTAALRNGVHVLEVLAYGKGRSDVWRKRIRISNSPFRLGTSGVSQTAPVSGVVRLRAHASTAVRSATLRVDGRVVARRTRAPFVFGWDSRRVRNGAHDLEVVARARDGRVATTTLTVSVLNRGPAASIVASSLASGQSVSGTITWQLTVKGPSQRMEFLVDGMLRSTRTFLPYEFTWDTSEVAPGQHTLTARLIKLDGTSTELTIPVTVAAPPAAP